MNGNRNHLRTFPIEFCSIPPWADFVNPPLGRGHFIIKRDFKQSKREPLA
jgi:hypothetical protein